VRRGKVLRLALPIMASGFVGQVVGLSTRIGIGYGAIDIGLSASTILVLTAAFSFVPIFLTTLVGRFTDREGAGGVILAGACILFVGAALPALLPPSVTVFVLSMTFLGIGQTFQIAAIQAEISRTGRPRHRDKMIGWFMVWQSTGQVTAPLLLTAASYLQFPAPYVALLWVSFALAALQVFMAFQIGRFSKTPRLQEQPMPLRQIITTPGLAWLAIAGSLCVATQEMTYVFMPLVATERGIDPGLLGIMLGAFSFTQLLARAIYPTAAARVGRKRLMAAALLATAAIFAGFAAPIPAFVMALLLATAGLSLGFAVTCSVSLTMHLAPVQAKGTALSLRLAVNRTGQFAMPLVAALTTPWLGAGGVFLTCGVVIGLCLPFLPDSIKSCR